MANSLLNAIRDDGWSNANAKRKRCRCKLDGRIWPMRVMACKGVFDSHVCNIISMSYIFASSDKLYYFCDCYHCYNDIA